MNRTLPLLSCLALLIVAVPQPILADSKAGVLQPFATLPAGLDAEGLAIRGDSFYVGAISFTGTDGSVLVFDKSGALTQTFTIPGYPAVGQVALSKDDLFAVACSAFSPTATGAVVEVDLKSGAVMIVATEGTCPNGLAMDNKGNMYITNIFDGSVSKVTPGGAVSTFASGGLLAPAPFDGFGNLGPNDIAIDNKGGALYVTNTGQNTVVKIQINKDGSAGAVSLFSTGVPGPDGVAFDKKGDLVVTSPFTGSVYLVAPDGSASLLVFDTTAVGLNNPSNVAFQGNDVYITNLDISGTSGYIVDAVLHPSSG
jgi:sugar lactone lactonase YvrE